MKIGFRGFTTVPSHLQLGKRLQSYRSPNGVNSFVRPQSVSGISSPTSRWFGNPWLLGEWRKIWAELISDEQSWAVQITTFPPQWQAKDRNKVRAVRTNQVFFEEKTNPGIKGVKGKCFANQGPRWYGWHVTTLTSLCEWKGAIWSYPSRFRSAHPMGSIYTPEN